LKFFVNSSFSHCSAAERRKFPRQPDAKWQVRYFVKRCGVISKLVTFTLPVRDWLSGRTTGSEEE
jgi:hypothetical protein